MPLCTRLLGPGPGILAVFLLYWFGFCLPVGWWFQPDGQWRSRLSLQTRGRRWVPWSVGGLALVLGAAALVQWPRPVPPAALLWALPLACLNGFCEEFFWRGAYLAQRTDSNRLAWWGVGLFTLWHVPLLWAEGGSYHGPYVMVGGPLLLGMLWMRIALSTRRIGWSVLSHVTTNALVFVDLISKNYLG
ncbi:CPBP family intramembrane glutamic endopeptidase [Roseimaritima sediminicola]|uniref:CPBP family intramembrane glutamic endopeptidase n=1 Tax=Roseimaritima sediminicola TaxID=2662066 RepID=UPI0013869ABE|nr:CPBP family intramembrane glutamic endopeptidase [Roseimaritima sediminicola]